MHRSRFSFRPKSKIPFLHVDDNSERANKNRKEKEKYRHQNFWLSQSDDLDDLDHDMSPYYRELDAGA